MVYTKTDCCPKRLLLAHATTDCCLRSYIIVHVKTRFSRKNSLSAHLEAQCLHRLACLTSVPLWAFVRRVTDGNGRYVWRKPLLMVDVAAGVVFIVCCVQNLLLLPSKTDFGVNNGHGSCFLVSCTSLMRYEWWTPFGLDNAVDDGSLLMIDGRQVG